MFGLSSKPRRPKVVAFDILDTVFDLEPLRSRFEDLGLPGSALELVYASALRDAMALAAAGAYEPFRRLMRSALVEALARHALSATKEELDAALQPMKTLPPHDDASAAFELLHGAGITVVALSNGAASATKTLLTTAGLDKFVARIFSTDDVKLAKPRPEVYLYAVEGMGAEPADVMLVAVHPWDVNGAKSAGLLGGYVCRYAPYPDEVMKAPDIQGDTLLEVARAIIDMKVPAS